MMHILQAHAYLAGPPTNVSVQKREVVETAARRLVLPPASTVLATSSMLLLWMPSANPGTTVSVLEPPLITNSS